MLPQSKEECIAWQQDILDRATKLVAEESAAKNKAQERVRVLERVIDVFRFDGMSRTFSITEQELNLLGFKVIAGRVEA